MPRCEQCGTGGTLLEHEDYGLLCPECAYRQNEHDERRDTFGGLTASSFGFLSDTE